MCYWYRLVVVVWGWLCQGAPARAWWGVEEGVVLLYWIKGVFLYWVVYCGEWWSACTVDSPAAHTDNNGPVTHPILVQGNLDLPGVIISYLRSVESVGLSCVNNVTDCLPFWNTSSNLPLLAITVF